MPRNSTPRSSRNSYTSSSRSYDYSRPKTPTIYNNSSYMKNNLERKSNLTKQSYSSTEKKALNKSPSTPTSSTTQDNKPSIITSMKDAFFQGIGFSLAHNIVSGFFRDNKSQNTEIKNEPDKQLLYEKPRYEYTSDECYNKRHEYNSCKIFGLREDCDSIKKEFLYELCFDKR